MHIHPSSPNSAISEEDAATKIQAGFRGYRVRKQLKENVNNGATQTAPNPRQSNIGTNSSSTISSSTVLNGNYRNAQINHNNCNNSIKNGELKPQNGVVRMTPAANSNLDKYATKIQASVRGFLVRKKHKLANSAATKIQAGFRGFRARKQLKKSKQ